MGLQGYVGSGEDVRRIRRQEQQLEEERKTRESEKQQRDANVSAAGFRQFGKGAAEVSNCSTQLIWPNHYGTAKLFPFTMQTLEAAIGQQTVGLVTRAEFAEKQKTLQEQIAAHQDKRKREEVEAANKVQFQHDSIRTTSAVLVLSNILYLHCTVIDSIDSNPLSIHSGMMTKAACLSSKMLCRPRKRSRQRKPNFLQKQNYPLQMTRKRKRCASQLTLHCNFWHTCIIILCLCPSQACRMEQSAGAPPVTCLACVFHAS